MDRKRWRTTEELFGGSVRWHQEKVKDFCGRPHSQEDGSKTEQGNDVVVCLPGVRTEQVTRDGKGGSTLLHTRTNQIIMSEILSVVGGRS